MDDCQLIAKAQQGNQPALSLLLQKHYSFLKKYLLKITLHPQLAEDLTQETLVKAIEKISLYNGSSSFSSWLMTIASRLYIDFMRRQRVEQKWTEHEKTTAKIRWVAESQDKGWSAFTELLASLSKEQRIPLILKHYYGYTYGQIAEMLGVNEGTVKSRIHYATQQLRKEWSDHE